MQRDLSRTLAQLEDDVFHRRHLADPFSERFVRFLTSDAAAGDLSCPAAVELAAQNIELRTDLVKALASGLEKELAHVGPRKKSKQLGREGGGAQQQEDEAGPWDKLQELDMQSIRDRVRGNVAVEKALLTGGPGVAELAQRFSAAASACAPPRRRDAAADAAALRRVAAANPQHIEDSTAARVASLCTLPAQRPLAPDATAAADEAAAAIFGSMKAISWAEAREGVSEVEGMPPPTEAEAAFARMVAPQAPAQEPAGPSPAAEQAAPKQPAGEEVDYPLLSPRSQQPLDAAAGGPPSPPIRQLDAVAGSPPSPPIRPQQADGGSDMIVEECSNPELHHDEGQPDRLDADEHPGEVPQLHPLPLEQQQQQLQQPGADFMVPPDPHGPAPLPLFQQPLQPLPAVADIRAPAAPVWWAAAGGVFERYSDRVLGWARQGPIRTGEAPSPTPPPAEDASAPPPAAAEAAAERALQQEEQRRQRLAEQAERQRLEDTVRLESQRARGGGGAAAVGGDAFADVCISVLRPLPTAVSELAAIAERRQAGRKVAYRVKLRATPQDSCIPINHDPDPSERRWEVNTTSLAAPPCTAPVETLVESPEAFAQLFCYGAQPWAPAHGGIHAADPVQLRRAVGAGDAAAVGELLGTLSADAPNYPARYCVTRLDEVGSEGDYGMDCEGEEDLIPEPAAAAGFAADCAPAGEMPVGTGPPPAFALRPEPPPPLSAVRQGPTPALPEPSPAQPLPEHAEQPAAGQGPPAPREGKQEAPVEQAAPAPAPEHAPAAPQGRVLPSVSARKRQREVAAAFGALLRESVHKVVTVQRRFNISRIGRIITALMAAEGQQQGAEVRFTQVLNRAGEIDAQERRSEHAPGTVTGQRVFMAMVHHAHNNNIACPMQQQQQQQQAPVAPASQYIRLTPLASGDIRIAHG